MVRSAFDCVIGLGGMMTREQQRQEVQKFVKSAKGNRLFEGIERQTGKKLSRVEKELLAIDCLGCIGLNTGKLDELRKLGEAYGESL